MPAFDTLSDASVIYRVNSEPDFKLAAAGSASIEIERPGETGAAWLRGFKLAASPVEELGAEIDGLFECLLVWEEGMLTVASAAGCPTVAAKSLPPMMGCANYGA